MAMVVVGFEIRDDSELARELVLCTVRRFTGNDEATPDTAPGPLPITVQAESHERAIAHAERCIDECAAELELKTPWEYLTVLRPD
jgi:hypothetical protein